MLVEEDVHEVPLTAILLIGEFSGTASLSSDLGSPM